MYDARRGVLEGAGFLARDGDIGVDLATLRQTYRA